MEAADQLKRLLSIYKDSEDLINIGAYQKGSNPNIDIAMDNIEAIWDFTKQKTNEKLTFEEAQERLIHEFYKG